MGILGWENPWKRGSTERGQTAATTSFITSCQCLRALKRKSTELTSTQQPWFEPPLPPPGRGQPDGRLRQRAPLVKQAAQVGGDSSRLQLRNPYECRIVQFSRPTEIDLQERMDPRLVRLRRAPYR